MVEPGAASPQHAPDASALEAQLAPLRTKIDALDAQLVGLLNERARVALAVGEVKKKYGADVFSA